MASIERVRLHITPFNRDLFDRYIPPALKPQATNISFHTIETFPERGFGYVELPAMEAQKLKTRLNGSTLRGTKVKIEEAKPEKKRKKLEPVEDEEKKVRKKAKKEKQKKENGVIPGHELPEGRLVQRGWVDDATKKGKKLKDGLEGKKMRFKTEVPANKVVVDEKEKGSKDKEKKEKKGKRGGKKATVVKEFSKASKPSTTAALRGKQASSYKDGRGWVNADGKVVEEEPEISRRTRNSRKAAEPTPTPGPLLEPGKDQSSSESMEEDEEEEASSSPESDASSIATSSSDNEEALDRQLSEAKSNTATNAAAELQNHESTIVRDAVPPSNPETKEIHPLEALFKRPAPIQISPESKRPTPIDTSFGFFSADGESEDNMAEAQIPQTPHTKQDLEWRSIRSAAPTPDTAAIGKKFNFSFGSVEPESENDDEIDAEMVDVEDTRPGAGGKEESEFRKWFYDNRGDLNRAWKKRRREERKVVRQRENKRLSRRIA